MDDELRKGLRQAEVDGDYQRLYTLLNRAGRPEDALKLFLDHPIQVECVVRYRYEANWSQRLLESAAERPIVYAWTEQEVLDALIARKIGASRLTSVQRIATYHILGSDITKPYSDGPLPNITFNEEELLQFKLKLRNHPQYMVGASAEQIERALKADDYDERRARQRAETERQQLLAQQRKRVTREQFDAVSPRHQEEAWALWLEHHHKTRAEFGKCINHHPVAFVLFHLKHRQDEFGVFVTRDVYDASWEESEERRYRYFRRNRQQEIEAAWRTEEEGS